MSDRIERRSVQVRMAVQSPLATADRSSIDATSIGVAYVTHIIDRLIAAHQMLNREIRRELARRAPDRFRLTRLKKERLAIKDRLFRHFPDAAEMRRVARIALRRVHTA
jgi:uncharacterized protein YdcH (DUF465 family)